MAETPTRVIGNIADNAPSNKTRVDGRFILTTQENIELDSGNEYIVLNEAESGALQSIRIVTDNPYLQVELRLDDYVNKPGGGQSAAELIYNGNSDTANRGFKVIDGQGSGKGYVMEYRPDVPEDYKGRISLVLRNQIKRTTGVYGMELSYTSQGTLVSPAVPAHMAGGTFSHPALRSASMGQVAKAMTKPVGVEGYSSNQVYNEATIFNDLELGSDHPYQGIAGQPFFQKDSSSENYFEVAALSDALENTSTFEGQYGRFRLSVIDETDAFPGTSATPSSMKVAITFDAIYAPEALSQLNTRAGGLGSTPWHTKDLIRTSDLQSKGPFNDTWPGTSTYTPFTGGTSLTGGTLSAAETYIGKRFFFRRGGTVYFPGVIKSITKVLAPTSNVYTAAGANALSVSPTAGVGFYLDSDADSTEDALQTTGVYDDGTNPTYVVTPYFPEWNSLADGIIVGTSPTYTTAGGTGLKSGLPDGAGGIAAGTDFDFIPQTAWSYIIEFEPGVTNVPIDFNPIPVNELPQSEATGNISTPYLSTGGFANGYSPTTDENCWGIVTSQADTNPKVLIKQIEVKRSKKVSFDG